MKKTFTIIQDKIYFFTKILIKTGTELKILNWSLSYKMLTR